MYLTIFFHTSSNFPMLIQFGSSYIGRDNLDISLIFQNYIRQKFQPGLCAWQGSVVVSMLAIRQEILVQGRYFSLQTLNVSWIIKLYSPFTTFNRQGRSFNQDFVLCWVVQWLAFYHVKLEIQL